MFVELETQLIQSDNDTDFGAVLATITKFYLSWDFQNVVCLLCIVNITGNLEI